MEEPLPQRWRQATGELAAAIDEAFGSFDKFRAQFHAAATTVQGRVGQRWAGTPSATSC
ncbi:superoxide dismutase [Mycobacterium ulcerans str. Harvey]|uniref:Superoxide dismutase n=1 Tax=Mycobacterium ulcerans str. Harvey TaxID=1299332 RepID=A0ABP3A1F1_MYCUL|nr:superoxide dismutase [Mycobacterium ulcerans str. Harvey]